MKTKLVYIVALLALAFGARNEDRKIPRYEVAYL